MGLLSDLRDMVVNANAARELEQAELEQTKRLADAAEAGGARTGKTALGPKIRRRYHFVGSVQGVGFRYQAMYGARNLGLTGWVSNLSDGSVEMEVQGPVAVIDHMIHNLQKGRWIRIEGMESKVIPVVPGERGFQVRGY